MGFPPGTHSARAAWIRLKTLDFGMLLALEMEAMHPSVTPLRPSAAGRMLACLVLGLLAAVTPAATRPDGSIAGGGPAEIPAECRSCPASRDRMEHAGFRNILQDPHDDSEAYWDRQQRWGEILKPGGADEPPPALQANGSAPLPLLNSVPISALSLALTPILMAVGLLRLR